MAGRIQTMRTKLYDALQEVQAPGNWDSIKEQIGMFSFTGLTAEQVGALMAALLRLKIKPGSMLDLSKLCCR